MAGPVQGYRALAQACYDAIFKITSGTLQSYSIRGVTYTKQDLTTLNSLAKEYERKAASEEMGGSSFRTAADFSDS